MSKRIIVFAAILAVSLMGAAFAEVENIKVSGDITVYGISRTDYDGHARQANYMADDISALMSIMRLRVDADLTEDVSATVRLINSRVWGEVTNANTDIDLDLAYVTLREFLGYPITLMVGRQEIKLGQGMIVGDPTPVGNGFLGTAADSNLPSMLGDLDPRKAFDAIVAIVDLEALDIPFTVTSGYAKIDEGAETTAPSGIAREDDTNLWFVNVGFPVLDTTMTEVYYILKDDQQHRNASDTETRTGLADSKDYVGNFGVRAVSQINDNLSAVGEIAYQHAKPRTGDSKTRSDLGFLIGAEWAFLEEDWNPTLGIHYAYFSRNWDPMYEDLTPTNIVNAIFPNSNISCIGLTATAAPQEDILLKLQWCNYKLAEKLEGMTTFTTPYAVFAINEDKDVGNEIDLAVLYDYTEDVQMGLNFDTFMPGDFFHEDNDDTAFQVLSSLKVSF